MSGMASAALIFARDDSLQIVPLLAENQFTTVVTPQTQNTNIARYGEEPPFLFVTRYNPEYQMFDEMLHTYNFSSFRLMLMGVDYLCFLWDRNRLSPSHSFSESSPIVSSVREIMDNVALLPARAPTQSVSAANYDCWVVQFKSPFDGGGVNLIHGNIWWVLGQAQEVRHNNVSYICIREASDSRGYVDSGVFGSWRKTLWGNVSIKVKMCITPAAVWCLIGQPYSLVQNSHCDRGGIQFEKPRIFATKTVTLYISIVDPMLLDIRVVCLRVATWQKDIASKLQGCTYNSLKGGSCTLRVSTQWLSSTIQEILVVLCLSIVAKHIDNDWRRLQLDGNVPSDRNFVWQPGDNCLILNNRGHIQLWASSTTSYDQLQVVQGSYDNKDGCASTLMQALTYTSNRNSTAACSLSLPSQYVTSSQTAYQGISILLRACFISEDSLCINCYGTGDIKNTYGSSSLHTSKIYSNYHLLISSWVPFNSLHCAIFMWFSWCLGRDGCSGSFELGWAQVFKIEANYMVYISAFHQQYMPYYDTRYIPTFISIRHEAFVCNVALSIYPAQLSFCMQGDRQSTVQFTLAQQGTLLWDTLVWMTWEA